MYYVRSISRRARIYSLITYTTNTTERDVILESSIKSAIRSFSLTSGQKPSDGMAATGTGPTLVIPGGADMIMGQEYTSPNGQFRTVFQNDGNLCVYGGSGMTNCRDTFTKYGAAIVVEKDGNCYGQFSTRVTQANAYAACKRHGATLATINNATENSLVAGLSNNGWSWLGADDLEKEGTWKWANGEEFTFQNWGKGEPNNSGNEDCAHTWGGGTWNDLDCNARINYICEAEQATEAWCSMTAGIGARASVQNNDMIIYNAAGKAVWTTSKDRVGQEGATQLVMQDDGNLVLYSAGNEAIASTGQANALNGVMIGRPGGDHVVATVKSGTSDRSAESRQSGRQSTKSTGSSIQISTKAIGLGKQLGTMLISYDIDTYKKAVESAFKATLPDNVGKVSAIEVVPWMENTEFQSLFKLEEKVVPAFDRMGIPEMDITDPAKPVQKTKKVLPYEQKRILQTNAEFLAEVDRAARAKLNVFYKAKMCRAQIDADYMVMNENTGVMYFPEDQEAIGNAIEIIKASYGANCNPKNVDNMTEILAEACNNASECDYQIEIATIGDPAVGCAKAYEVEYRCMAPAPRGYHHQAIAKEASGKKLTIDCVNPPSKSGAAAADIGAIPAFGNKRPPRPHIGQTTYVFNNRKANESMVLEEVVNMLSPDKLQRLWMEYDSFMYGGTGEEIEALEKDPAARGAMARAITLGTKPELGYPKNVFPGAGRCIAELFTLGITAMPYRSIKYCQRVEESFATISGQRIDDYCMPRFTRVPGQESIEVAMEQEAQAGDSVNRERVGPATAAALPPTP
jgi:hypothetical protein